MIKDDMPEPIGVFLVWTLRIWAALLFLGIVWELGSMQQNQSHVSPSIVLDEAQDYTE